MFFSAGKKRAEDTVRPESSHTLLEKLTGPATLKEPSLGK